MKEQNLETLISAAVAAKMKPDFIEKEVYKRIEKLLVDCIDNSLRSYSDIGKMVQKAVGDALRVNNLDLPSYGHIVTQILKQQIEANVSPLVAGRLSADMEELLKLAPKTIKLSAIAKDMCEKYEGEACGEVVTVIVYHTEYGTTWIYLDENTVYDESDKYRAQIRMCIDKDGLVASAMIGELELRKSQHIGRSYGLEQKVRAWVACGTIIEIDEDYVSTSVGDH